MATKRKTPKAPRATLSAPDKTLKSPMLPTLEDLEDEERMMRPYQRRRTSRTLAGYYANDFDRTGIVLTEDEIEAGVGDLF